MHELGTEGTEPGLLWPLLLVQIVYDELVTKNGKADFAAVAQTYAAHPLLPAEAPMLSSAAEAEQLYTELLREREIDRSLAPIAQAQALAEPLYLKFQESLVASMSEDANEFERVYRRFEEAHDVPRDERLADPQ